MVFTPFLLCDTLVREGTDNGPVRIGRTLCIWIRTTRILGGSHATTYTDALAQIHINTETAVSVWKQLIV